MRVDERLEPTADLVAVRRTLAVVEADLGPVPCGHGRYVLLDADGEVRQLGKFGGDHNLVTDTGDEYFAKRGAPISVNTPTGMRLGTGTTAPAKNGAGAAIVTYVTASQKAIDGTYPTAATLGAGLGWREVWRTTWNAGEATANAIAEVVITNETPITNVAGSAANSVARALISPVVNKASGDTLVVTWNIDLLGA